MKRLHEGAGEIPQTFYGFKGHYFGGGPSVPQTPPPPPILQQPNVTAAGVQQMQMAKGANGSSSDILTSGSGVPGPANTATKNLLGG